MYGNGISIFLKGNRNFGNEVVRIGEILLDLRRKVNYLNSHSIQSIKGHCPFFVDLKRQIMLKSKYEDGNMARNKKEKKKNSNVAWIIKITIAAFFISFVFSFASELILKNVGLAIGIVVLLAFILIGVIFDMIGVAITSADITPFNSMGAKKMKGANVAVNFIKNADKLSTFCNDVVGDICGIISGSATAVVAVLVSSSLDISLLISTLTVTSITAAFTIGGKAIGKGIAIKNNTSILYGFAKVVSIFYRAK